MQSVWITKFANELSETQRGRQDGGDICNTQIVKVLQHIEKFMEKFPNPVDAVVAMSYTAKINFLRDEAIHRGEGVRRGRKVEKFPTLVSSSGEEIEIDLVDRSAADPETEAIIRDQCRRAVAIIRPIVAIGLVLTTIVGLNQSQAAEKMNITRTYLSRQIKQSQRQMRKSKNF